MSGLILETTDTRFETDVLNSDLPVLLDFWAPWCKPCLALVPQLEAIAKQYDGKLRVVKLNVDDHPNTSKLFAVRGLPTLITFARGEVHGRATGSSALSIRVLAENAVGVPSALPVEVQEKTVLAATALFSFHGDQALKQACLTRLRETVFGSHDKPSDAAAGEKDRFTDVLGLPDALGRVIDIIYSEHERTGDEPGSRARLVALYEAIPVGVDLGRVSAALAHWLLYSPDWGIGRHVQPGPAQVLFARIAALHEQEAASAGTHASWEALTRDVIAYVGANQPAGDSDLPGRASHFADLFEQISAPLSEIDVASVLSGPADLASRDYDAYPDWSDQDEGKLIEINRSCTMEALDEVGPPPKKPAEAKARDAWREKFIPRLKQAIVSAKELEPAFWARTEAWKRHQLEVAVDFNGAVTAFIHVQFAQAATLSQSL
ncbi:thioredoxin domain-containing protein [Paraburkholderia sediminicola]|uniref:thioredoxin domain-containing protein n=1 Tax=Paraburkholderia sediminicola TaxID=458836 RepID=UPI0038BC1B30